MFDLGFDRLNRRRCDQVTRKFLRRFMLVWIGICALKSGASHHRWYRAICCLRHLRLCKSLGRLRYQEWVVYGVGLWWLVYALELSWDIIFSIWLHVGLGHSDDYVVFGVLSGGELGRDIVTFFLNRLRNRLIARLWVRVSRARICLSSIMEVYIILWDRWMLRTRW